jgi:predicted transcriptional regulator
MPYTEQNIRNSEIALDVLREIADSEDGAYTKQISDTLDSPETTISHIVNELRNLEIIKRGKRTKAQYYEVNYGGMSSYWFEELEKYARECDPKPELDVENLAQSTEEHEEEIRGLAESFFERALKSKRHRLTLEQFMFSNFALTMKNYQYLFQGETVPESVEITEFLLMTLSDTPTYRGELLEALVDQEMISPPHA